MAALIPDERCVVLASSTFSLQIKAQQAIPCISAATYKVIELHWSLYLSHELQLLNDLLHVVVGRQRVYVGPDVVDEVVPGHGRERVERLPPVRQVGHHRLKESGQTREALS